MMNVLHEGFSCKRCGGRSGRVSRNGRKVCSDCADGNARMTRTHSSKEQVRRATGNGRLLMTWGGVSVIGAASRKRLDETEFSKFLDSLTPLAVTIGILGLAVIVALLTMFT